MPFTGTNVASNYVLFIVLQEKLGKSARRALHVVQQIQVKFRSNQQCRENAHNPATITDRVICAGNSSANEDACKGDRGSPLVVSDPVIDS